MLLTAPAISQFVPFQPISTAIGKRVGQARWLSFISFGWGILTLAHAFVKTKGQVIAVRLLIGVFEAGLYVSHRSACQTGEAANKLKLPIVSPDRPVLRKHC